MNLQDVILTVKSAAPDAVLVSQLGSVSKDLYLNAHSSSNLYLLGGMGSVIPTAQGLALSTSNHVIALEGDGSLLMNLGTLATVSRYPCSNLVCVILSNGVYQNTGGQPVSTVDYTTLAESLGLESFFDCYSIADLARALSDDSRAGPKVAVANVVAEDGAQGPFPLTPADIAKRFQATKCIDHGARDMSPATER